MDAMFIFLALGVFAGNLFLTPLFMPGKTMKDGFWIGLIAAALILLVGLFVPDLFSRVLL